MVMRKVIMIINHCKIQNNLYKHSWNSLLSTPHPPFCSKSVRIKQSLVPIEKLLRVYHIHNFLAGKSDIAHHKTTEIVNVVYGLHNLVFFQEISLKTEIQKHAKTCFNIVVCVLKDRKLRKGKNSSPIFTVL